MKTNKFYAKLKYYFENLPFNSLLFSRKVFQCSLFLEITTLVTLLKSTLLLKIKCFDTHIYMKTQCLQTNKTQHYLESEMLEKQGG